MAHPPRIDFPGVPRLLSRTIAVSHVMGDIDRKWLSHDQKSGGKFAKNQVWRLECHMGQHVQECMSRILSDSRAGIVSLANADAVRGGKNVREMFLVVGVGIRGLLRSELFDQLAQSFPLDWPQIQELHAEHLSSDPPNDSMVNMHSPVMIWGKDPQVEAHVGPDGSLRLGCTACAGQIEESRISFYQFGT